MFTWSVIPKSSSILLSNTINETNFTNYSGPIELILWNEQLNYFFKHSLRVQLQVSVFWRNKEGFQEHICIVSICFSCRINFKILLFELKVIPISFRPIYKNAFNFSFGSVPITLIREWEREIFHEGKLISLLSGNLISSLLLSVEWTFLLQKMMNFSFSRVVKIVCRTRKRETVRAKNNTKRKLQ